MISWIQITFEKHTKAFLAFLLIVITIPFVFTIGAAPGIGRGERSITKREFFGYNLVSPADQRRISFDAQISIMLRVGQMININGAQLQNYAFQRAASLALADRYRLPQPTAAQRDKFLTSLRIFQNEQGQFDAVRYNQIRDDLRTKTEFSEADVARVLAEECRIERLGELLAGPGYVAPVEIVNRVALASTQWTLNVAVLDLAAYNPVAKPTDEILAKFYEDNKAGFEISERANVDYVTFRLADFTAADPLSDDDVVAFFEANKARFATPAADGKPAAEPTLATARPQVEAAMRAALAARRAAAAASDFAFELYEQSAAKKVTKDSADLDAIVAKYKGHRSTAPLFTRNAPPAGLPWTRQIVETAFTLDDARFYSDALPLGSDQIVLLWRETLPKYQPLLAEVRDQVLAAYTENEKGLALQRNGAAWKTALETKLAAGQKFDAAVATLSGVPANEIKSFGPFTRRQPAEGVPAPVLGSLERLAAGSVSDLLLDETHAYLVQVVEKKVPAIDANSPEYAQLGAALAANAANAARELALDELVQAELARTAPSTPEAE